MFGWIVIAAYPGTNHPLNGSMVACLEKVERQGRLSEACRLLSVIIQYMSGRSAMACEEVKQRNVIAEMFVRTMAGWLGLFGL